MQLQMTAPLDIGLEFQDQALGLGQDDILDLEMSKKQLGKRKTYVDLVNLVDDKDGFESDEEEQGEETMGEDEENLDSDGENKKVDELEAELDGLYDSYQERLRERDAKYRVKEARRKDKSREEWHGIQQQDGDSDDSEESEGGYDVVLAAKARFGEDSDSDWDSESVDDSNAPSNGGKLKRWRGADAEVDGRQSKKAKMERLETSRATSMWFDQDVFAGVDLKVSDDEGGDEDIHNVESGDEDVNEEDGEDAPQSEGSVNSGDDFEVVPQEDQDEEMWDVELEDQDEINQSKIKSTVIEARPQGTTSADDCCRIWFVNRRSRLYSSPTCQPGNHQNSPGQRRVQPLLPQFQRRITCLVPRRRGQTLQIKHTYNEGGGGRPPGSSTCPGCSSNQEDCRGQGS